MRGLGIDGRPAVWLEMLAPGGTLLTEPGSVQLADYGQYGDRSLFLVWDLTAVIDSTRTMAGMSAYPGPGLAIGFDSGNGSRCAFSYMPDGGSNVYKHITPDPPQRLVSATWTTDAATIFSYGVLDGSAATSVSVDPANGLDDTPNLLLGAPQPYGAPLATFAVPQSFDTRARTAIMRTLLVIAEREYGPFEP